MPALNRLEELPGRQVLESVGAADAVLEQDGPVAIEGEHLEHVSGHLVRAVRVANRHADGDVWPRFDELGRLEVKPVATFVAEEVDHLLAVSSGRRGAVEAAAGYAEPLRLLGEQFAETADVTPIERGKRLLETIGAFAHHS